MHVNKTITSNFRIFLHILKEIQFLVCKSSCRDEGVPRQGPTGDLLNSIQLADDGATTAEAKFTRGAHL